MNPIKNNGKYFIRDVEISDSINDKFKHFDIAKNIINIIENNKPPFNIAIVGKWGLGKSSLINIVKKQLLKNSNNYIIEDINAWKYEKEAMKRVLLRKILSSLEYTDKNAIAQFFDELTSFKGSVQENKNSFFKNFISEWCPIIKNAVIIYVIGIIISIIGQCLVSKINVSSFDFNDWINYIFNGFVSNFYFPLLVVLFEKFIGASSGKYNFRITPPMTSVDEYERELEKRLTDKKYKNKKIIVIVDDLDRLTPNKIVEALDAIKAFVGYTNFVFIVPFDDTILKDAIKREKTNLVYNEHLTIESDLFLDKLFQYRISIPNAIQSDIPQYAIEVTQKDAKDLIELCGQNEFSLICKEILIHKKVNTPRQAKKIVNTFANNLLLGYRREQNGVTSGLFTSSMGKRFLAKISVLQADFPAFYSNLFVDNDIIDDFLFLTDQEEIDEIKNELLLPYFTKNDDEDKITYKLNKTGESLSMFLHRTAAITSKNIARFLYLNEDRLSELFGNEFSSTIRDGLTSGDYKLVRDKLENNLDKDIKNLLYEILSNTDSFDFEFCCIGIINVSDMNGIKDDRRLMSLVNERLESIFVSKDTIAAKGLNLLNAIDILNTYHNFKGLDQLILNKFKNESDDFNKSLTVYFEKEDCFSNDVKIYVRDLIVHKCSTAETKLTFNNLFEIETLNIDTYYDEYFSDIQLFERLYDELVTEENYNKEDSTVLAFIKIFEKHIQNNKGDQVLGIVEQNFDNTEFVELLSHTISSFANKFKDFNLISNVSSKLIAISNDNIVHDINLWLGSVRWEILSGEEERVDKYIKENLDSEFIDSILLNVVDNNQVVLIPKTIESIHNTLFENNIKISTINELQKKYDNTQMTKLFEKLKIPFGYSNSDVDKLANATELLNLISHDTNRENYITTIADYIYNQNASYPTHMIEKLRKISEFKQGIPLTEVEKFLNWSKSHINSYKMAAMTILDLFKEEVPETEYTSFGKKIMENATEDNLELSLSLLRKFRTEFTSDNGLMDIYEDFLMNRLSNNYCRKSIIKDILDSFSKINNVDKFICEIAKYDDIINESKEAIIRFTEEYTDNQIENVVQNVIETVDAENIDNIMKIFLLWLGMRYSLIIKHLLEKVDKSIKISYGMNLAKISMQFDDVDVTLKINLLSILLDICDDSFIPDILMECKKIGNLTNKLNKRKLGEALYSAFRNTDKVDFKIQILSVVKETVTKSAFETDELRNKREFSDDEKELMKHYK